MPELQGRFPIRVELTDLTKDDFLRILTEPKHSLTRQYAELLATEGVTLEFAPDGIEAVADIAFEVNRTMQNIGARRLHTILERVVEDLSFEGSDLADKHVVHRRRIRSRPAERDHAEGRLEQVYSVGSRFARTIVREREKAHDRTDASSCRDNRWPVFSPPLDHIRKLAPFGCVLALTFGPIAILTCSSNSSRAMCRGWPSLPCKKIYLLCSAGRWT